MRICHLRVAQDCTDDVVEVVRYSACKGAERLHSASLLQTDFQTLLLLLENDSADSICDGVERHAKERKFGPLSERSRAQRIETKDRFRFLAAQNAQPALEVDICQEIN